MRSWPLTSDDVFERSAKLSTTRRLLQLSFVTESFTVQHPCQFCMVKRSDIQKSVGQKLQTYLQQVRPENTAITAKRTAVLPGLPVILGDENTDFFKTCFDCEDPDVSHTPIGILTIIPEDRQASPDSLHFESSGTAIILEGSLVMNDVGNLPRAMCLLFGLIYALNLDYPQQLKYTFDFIQRVLLSLGHKSLKPKIQSLKNLLMQ